MKRIFVISALAVLHIPFFAFATLINIPADYPTIQQGIDAGADGDTVLVAEGHYYERINFYGKGVFLASELLLDGDTLHIQNTIIDADTSVLGIADTASVVCFVNGEDSTATIYGFTLQKGIGTIGFNGTRYGGGIYCNNNSSPNIRDNIISNNFLYSFSSRGGGIFCGDSSPNIINNSILDNYSVDGAGIYCLRAEASIRSNNILGNNANRGAAFNIDHCDPTVSDNVVVGNSVYVDGAGFYITHSQAIITGNFIHQNFASRDAAAIYCRSHSNSVISFNTISENTADFDGGGIFILNSDPIIYGNSIIYNVALENGGGIICYQQSEPLISKNLITGNSANIEGGGVLNISNSNPTLEFNTISKNIANIGGGIFSENYTVMSINSTIIWDNYAPQAGSNLYIMNYSSVDIRYCDIQGGWNGEANLNIDPLFRNPENGDFHLMSIACGDSANSPCIDVGNPGIIDSILDCSHGLGAFYSDLGAYGGGSARDWNRLNIVPDEYSSIQSAISYTIDGDTVLVNPGRYYENLNFYGHNIIVGSLFLFNNDTSFISATIIDGSDSGAVVIFESGEDSNTVLIGLTIQNGYRYRGGGIYCLGSNPIIDHCLIKDNTAESIGGGIFCQNSNAKITNNKVRQNSAAGGAGISCYYHSSAYINDNDIRENIASGGGGIYCHDNSNSFIIGNNVIGNYAEGGGGGILFSQSNPLALNNIIRGNSSGEYAGGIYCSEGQIIRNIISENIALYGGGLACPYHDNATIKNNLIVQNSAFYGGGFYGAQESESIVSNNVFFENIADSIGGGIYCWTFSPTLINNIFRENIAPIGSELFLDSSYFPYVAYNNIQGGWPGQGNIDVHPIFRDPGNGDFHLMSIACGDSADSPCIDAGDPNILDSLLDCSWGLGGQRSDMGAYGGGDSLITRVFDNIQTLPDRFILLENYPNPFNAQTTIRFTLPEPQDVKLTIYDLLGRRVETLFDEYREAGVHTVTFDATHLSSGVYFYRLQAGEIVKTKRMILLK